MSGGMLLFGLLWGLSALAGDGPWTLEPNVYNLYVGADYFRYQRFSGAPGDPVVELGTGLTSYALNGVWTIGLRPGVEGEVKVAYESVRANQPDSEFCTVGRPDKWCKTTSGVGDVFGTLKLRFLDEYAGAPLSSALSLSIRSGEAYADRRGRLTTLGDGQTDVGAVLSVGRKLALGLQGLRTFATGGYFYRLPNRLDGDRKVPTDEVYGQLDVSWAPSPRFEVGPTAVLFSRTGGVNLDEIDFFDIDAWNTTDAAQLKLGGRLAVFSIKQRTLAISVLYTAYARNNPIDTLAISVGGAQLKNVRPETP